MPDVEIVAGPQLSVLAFRLNPRDRRPEALDALNERWLEAITRRQRILLSPTRLDGRLALRMALLSFRTHGERVRAGLEDIREAAIEVLEADIERATICGLFEQQARATPDRDALIFGSRRVTFGELDAAADRIARALRARGLREGGHVGIYLSRSAEAGGVYVPIDPNDPLERQRFHRTTLSFVDGVWEIFGPLLQGVPLVVLDAESTGDPDAIATAVREHRVTRLTAVPSILDPLVKRVRRTDALSSMRVLFSSGERLQAPLLARLRVALPQSTILNLYGSTEVAGDVTCAAFPTGADAPTADVPIGKAIANARLFVLDGRATPVEDGEEKELYVGGPVIAQGYHRRPEEHASRFVALPHLTDGALFRTGDRVRRDRGGVLHYVGRTDRQVKVRGVRIELDEVEAALLESTGPGVAGAVVARDRPSDGDSMPGLHVVAFVAPKTVDVDAIRQSLTKRLPAAMVPAIIVALEALPRLPNGKTDRQALLDTALPSSSVAPGGSSPTVRALEDLVLSLWARRLPARPTSVDSDLHALGGDSLDLVEFLTEVGEILGRTFPITNVPRLLTVAAMSRMLGQPADTCAALADPGIEVLSLSGEHRDAVLALLVESFSLREPMAAALRADGSLAIRARVDGALRANPFSYVAVAPDSGRVLGFCFGHDFVGPALAFDPVRESPRVVPLFDLLGRLHARYVAEARPRPGEVLEISATGAAPDVDGYMVARALERRALRDAAAHGFRRVVSLCTNAVTRSRALGEQRMRLIDEIEDATFEHEGRKVFLDAARHRGVAFVVGDTA